MAVAEAVRHPPVPRRERQEAPRGSPGRENGGTWCPESQTEDGGLKAEFKSFSMPQSLYLGSVKVDQASENCLGPEF